MRKIFKGDEWNIIQEGFEDKNSLFSESIFSLSNGYMGGRGNFEEGYGGRTLKSFFHAGVYYPDKARYGWYKVGYPLKNNKVINSPCVIGVIIIINGRRLDLFNNDFRDFKRTLNMKNGLLERSFVFAHKERTASEITVKRFLSMDNKNMLAVSFSIKPIDGPISLEFEPNIDGNVINSDSIKESAGFWDEIYKDRESLMVATKDNNFYIASSMKVKIYIDNEEIKPAYKSVEADRYIGQRYKVDLNKGDTIRIEKFISSFNSRNISKKNILKESKEKISSIEGKNFNDLLCDSEKKWGEIWNRIDIGIDGDVYSQQALRFNLFMLNSTYTGEDRSLNISPKGFSGEIYNGSTYWDTEIYCLPYFLYLDPEVAKNLILYRYNFLEQAINNAKLLMLDGALYPMITLDGNEGHAEWEITFMEIHRNSAIAFSIYNYIRATGDKDYMAKYGFEVIANIAKFWADRVTYSKNSKAYTIIGVTGPDEFHNNVNNNWYTNIMAKWALNYAYEQSSWLRNKDEKRFNKICQKYNINQVDINMWKEISNKIFLGREDDIFIQFEGFSEKEKYTVSDVPDGQLPVVYHWSWDRINRISLIKQADVILGLYLLGDNFTLEEKTKNFNFYEPRTLHESSLSPSIYSIIASEIGDHGKAFELFKKSAIYDLEDLNCNTDHGLHITSMGGTCLSVIEGFFGLSIRNDKLSISPRLPLEWESLRTRIVFRKRVFSILITKKDIYIEMIKGKNIQIYVNNNKFSVGRSKNLLLRY